MSIFSEKLTFSLLSFEGPDRYARAGGLGVRAGHLAEALALRDFETQFFFIGDPGLSGRELRIDGKLTVNRWCQWISRYYPLGVYHGEEDKLRDFSASVPAYLLEHVIEPAVRQGKIPVVLAEEWHTVDALIRLRELLAARGLADRVIMFWNANNTMSFHRVKWDQLREAAAITTVSRYMKHLMWGLGLNPLVIPNGIPEDLLKPVDEHLVEATRRLLDPDGETIVLFKTGRFDPAKRWMMAVEAAAFLKRAGFRVSFPLRGGIEPHGTEVLQRAYESGLSITDIAGEPSTAEELLVLLQKAPRADIYNFKFDLSQEMLRIFYASADAVLANSGHEPFGLVGLEAMAAGGIVFAGATGEEYLIASGGGIMLDTDLPEEIVSELLALRSRSDVMDCMRQAARERAARYTWDRAVDVILEKVRFLARARGLVEPAHYTRGPLLRLHEA